MSLRFLSVEAIELLHTKSVQRFGGSHGLRDRGLLESAVARAENLAYYSPEASIGELAATLGWGLIKNHVFLDGNKRIGAISLITFLDITAIACIARKLRRRQWCCGRLPARSREANGRPGS